MDAAFKLVKDLTKPERLKKIAGLYPDTIVVPVHGIELQQENVIPWCYAAVLGECGLRVDTGIVKLNKTGHTDKKGLERLIARANFGGRVKRGCTYLIVDDIVTQGGTVAELRHFIDNAGGHVVGVSSLAFSLFSSVLALKPEMVLKLEKKFGRTELESFLEENDIAGRIEAMTQSEARMILRFKTLSRIWGRVREERWREELAAGVGLLRKSADELASARVAEPKRSAPRRSVNSL